MNLQQQIGPMLLSAYRDQNVAQLKEWFNRFPEAINILTKAVGEAPLKAALRDNMWLSATFLLNQPNIPKKTIASSIPTPLNYLLLNHFLILNPYRQKTRSLF